MIDEPARLRVERITAEGLAEHHDLQLELREADPITRLAGLHGLAGAALLDALDALVRLDLETLRLVSFRRISLGLSDGSTLSARRSTSDRPWLEWMGPQLQLQLHDPIGGETKEHLVGAFEDEQEDFLLAVPHAIRHGTDQWELDGQRLSTHEAWLRCWGDAPWPPGDGWVTERLRRLHVGRLEAEADPPQWSTAGSAAACTSRGRRIVAASTPCLPLVHLRRVEPPGMCMAPPRAYHQPMLIAVEEAQRLVLEHAAALPAEDVPVAEIDGRIAAATRHARWSLPQRDVSIMDGYAVRSLDVATMRACGSALVLTVRGESAAGHPSDAPLGEGHAARISTGAVLPAGADAVIAQEDTRREGDRLVIDSESLGTLEPGTFVRPEGSELREGDVVARAGRRLGPGDIALLAGSGHATVSVHRRPTVAILSTGDELVPAGQRPNPGQVVSSNGLVLAAMVRRAGAIPIDLGEVGDEPEQLRAALARGLEHDVLVTSGGISVGDHDLVCAELTALGTRMVFRGVALRPGKPTTFAVTEGARVFGLPGNPASSLVTFALFVHPLLRRLLGVRGEPRLPTVRVRLQAPARGAGNRAHYVRARRLGPTTQGLLAEPLSVQQSGDLCSIAGADLLLPLPAGVGTLPEGTELDAIVLDPHPTEQPASDWALDQSSTP